MCAAATTLYRDWNKLRDYLRALPRRGVLIKRQLIGSRAIKETATAENVRLFGLFRCGCHNARTNSILDYMLREYGGSHDAHQAARFEFSAALYGSYVTVSSALYLNYRAILIHHHIRAQQCTSENKVERIIGRMTQRHAPKKIRRERGVWGVFMKAWTNILNNAALLAGALIPFANMEFVTAILPTLSDDTVGTLCEWAQRPALYALAPPAFCSAAIT